MLGKLRRLLWRTIPSTQQKKTSLATHSSRRLQTASSTDNNQHLPNPNDPYIYTSGRWLHRDKEQREARYIRFNFSALCKRAVDVCDGASKIIDYVKREGNFNRVFIMHMDNGKLVVAKIPFRVAGPPRLLTNSEVATMTYINSFTKIPVPKVLDWSDDGNNKVGTEYIIMEHVPGYRLQEMWPSMKLAQRVSFIRNVTKMIVEMAKLSFPAYGSLYFSDAPINPELKVQIEKGFCIGPHCGTQYWNCAFGENRFYGKTPPNRGPWNTFEQYCSGLLESGLSRIPPTGDSVDRPSFHGHVNDHFELLKISKSIITELSKDPRIQNVANPILLHPDIHKRNVFVSENDPCQLTAIIDWQSTCIEPTFVYADETPDFVEDPAADLSDVEEIISSDSDEKSTVEATNKTVTRESRLEKVKKKYGEDGWLCIQVFEVMLKGYYRKLHEARAMNQTLLRLFSYCGRSWKDSAAALRSELVDVSQQWNDLGLPGSCPYHPSSEELAEHKKQFEDFESLQKLKLTVLKLMVDHGLNADSDGWVLAKDWEASRKILKVYYDLYMESARETDTSESEVKQFWPFDEVYKIASTSSDTQNKESGVT